MGVWELSGMTWESVAGLVRAGPAGARPGGADPDRLVAVQPTGAMEAHGPHLPLETDVIIAGAMAREGARILATHDLDVLLLPPLAYSPAPFAAGFPGTISVRPQTLTALVTDIGRSLATWGVGTLAVANAHLDPAHIGALGAAGAALTVDAAGAENSALALRWVFPDITRRALAERLGDEFRSGACHAGRFETSIVMAERPEAVDDATRGGLAPVAHSLSVAIREGKRTFQEVGGDRAYFGDPAAATAEEGAARVAELGRILAEAVLAPGR